MQPRRYLPDAQSMIAIGLHINEASCDLIARSIRDRALPASYHSYQMFTLTVVNPQLDKIAFQGARFLEERGYRAYPFPANMPRRDGRRAHVHGPFGRPGGPRAQRLARGNYVKPTVAVMKFENRAPFPLNWNLGGGMREILVDRLVATKRYQVVERPELGSVVGELQLQQAGVTRPEGRAEPNRLKNVQYLVKGTVTDFGHVSTNRGFMSLLNGDIFSGTNRAVMGITLYVVDVESGEIITSESIEESVRASDVSVQTAYRDVSFGGSVFYQTPLGRATAKVIDKAVKRITTTIAASPWKPKVALVRSDGTVVLNGGSDRGVRRGSEYDVVEPGEPILDPDTGDRLGHAAFRRAGRIRVREVYPAYSAADVVRGVAGDFRPGLLCRKADSTPAPFEP